MSKIVHLVFNDSSLTVVGAIPELCDVLTYTHRSIDMEERGRPVVNEARAMFEWGPPHNGRPVLYTYQGLMGFVEKCLKENGCEIRYRDTRNFFPAPQLNRMFGFRFSQKALLTSALMPNKSGLIGAPTRYGKTTLIVNTLRAFPGLKTIVTAPGVDLLEQTLEDLQEKLPGREIKGIFTGSRDRIQSEDITVVSMDSLEKCDFVGTKLVLVDEPHAVVTDSRAHLLHNFVNARRIGYGASLSGRFDRADIMIQALIGPVLANKTYVEARDEGAVAPIEVCVLMLQLSPFVCSDRERAYKEVIRNNEAFHRTVAELCAVALPVNWQTLVFIKNEVQARGIQAQIPEAAIAMAKLMTKKERKAMTEQVKLNNIMRCVCSDIYSTGVTFHDVRALINAGGGGGSISCVQKPGRLAEVIPGKKAGVVIDFAWNVKAQDFPNLLSPEDALQLIPGNDEWKAVVRDAQARIRVYREKGYKITYHTSIASVKERVHQLI